MLKKNLTITDMQNHAIERGGKCLSAEYQNSKIQLEWECANGHTWFAAPSNIIYGKTWCPKCDSKKKLTITEMQNIAASYGGKCLSNAYVNTRTVLTWECKHGHQWTALPDQIKRGHWCPECQKLTICEMKSIAAKHGGECLSTEYINAQTPLKWKCNKGHIWETTPNSVKRGSWCRVCFIERQKEYKKYDIDNMQKIASNRGGKCLSTAYINVGTPLKWECSEKHIWWATPASLLYKPKSWCPVCAQKKKLTLEEMQLLAIDRGGKCLSTEYFNSKISLEWKCSNGHTWFAAPNNIKNGSWCPVCSNRVKHTLKDAKLIAETRGGKCLSSNYKNGLIPMEWECKNKHRWKSRFDSVLMGNWCSVCANENKKLTLKEMQIIASKRGGKCLSTEYINTSTKLEWKCSKGHTWFATPNGIKAKRWCPQCARQRKLLPLN